MSATKIEARITLLTTRIAADTLALTELQGQLAAAALINDVAAGWTVKFKVGRAETRREVEGVVLGRGEVKGVDSVRVQIGEGLECELFTIKVAELTGITAPEAAPASEIAVALGTAAAGQSEADELLNDLVG